MLNAITFALEKTEIMPFIGKRKSILRNLPSLRDGAREIHCKEAMRWLCVWFNPQLTFARRLKERSATAKRTVQHFHHFCSTGQLHEPCGKPSKLVSFPSFSTAPKRGFQDQTTT